MTSQLSGIIDYRKDTLENYTFHHHKQYRYRTLREAIEEEDMTVPERYKEIEKVIRNRLEFAKKRKKNYFSKYDYIQIQDIPLRYFLQDNKERTRFCALCRSVEKGNIKYTPERILYNCLFTGHIIYRHIPFRKYFDSIVEYQRAKKRIEEGWSIDEAIDKRKLIIPAEVNGKKGLQSLADKLGTTRAKAMYYIKSFKGVKTRTIRGAK